jgi:hypothetical protein
MSLQTDITSDLQTLIRDLRSAETRADDKLRGINIRAARELLKLARSIVHVRSGRLQASLHIEGPFDVGTGTLEARVTSNVPYAEEEVARGSEHDYAARTIDEGQSIIEQAAQDMEQALIAIMEGRL